MDVVVRKADPATRPAGLLAVGVAERAPLAGPAQRLDRATHGALAALLATRDFTGAPGQSALLYARGLRARRVFVVGLGRGASPERTTLLRAAALAARQARELGAGTLAIALDGTAATSPEDIATIAEGVLLGHHRHTAYRSGSKAPLKRVELLVPRASEALVAAAGRGVRRGEAVCLARDLANTPGQDLVPSALAARAQEIGASTGAKVTVMDVPALERLGMGCLLGVGRGSVNPPRFIVLEHAPRETKRRGGRPLTIVLIGKGVTFDTGGYSLKPREGMSKMKYDMSGAAAVLGVFASLPALDLPVRLVGLIPSAENMVSDRAVKPGDVLHALDGTTVEVTNTDAEGRLLLADALGYAKRLEPDLVVDLATLTGAISLALGRFAAGIFTRDDALAAGLIAAGEAVGERLWRMPLWDDYRVEMRGGDTADLVNSSERREGAACTAAAFLEHFARGLRWAHLDIASTAWTYEARPESARGPNAFGVRLLVEWLGAFARA
ncbi:MAG TPA: leucyl aminopeptidase [Candidatus Acidoferrales bacterium]|nr:leucyl aminopeptidase [Candidatus Acidoferrales bacterium]